MYRLIFFSQCSIGINMKNYHNYSSGIKSKEMMRPDKTYLSDRQFGMINVQNQVSSNSKHIFIEWLFKDFSFWYENCTPLKIFKNFFFAEMLTLLPSFGWAFFPRFFLSTGVCIFWWPLNDYFFPFCNIFISTPSALSFIGVNPGHISIFVIQHHVFKQTK